MNRSLFFTVLAASVLFFSAGFSAGARAEELGLNAYLDQVSSDGHKFRAAQAAYSAALRLTAEPESAYFPVLSARAQNLDNTKNDSPAAQFSPTEFPLEQRTYDVALRKRFAYGPELSIEYASDRMKLRDVPQMPGPFYQSSPTLTASVPLWRNLFGREIRASVNKVKYQIESSAKLSAFRMQGVLFDARLAYWKLKLARDNLVIRRDTVNRHKQLVEWADRRAKLRLSDEAEILQAQTALKVRELELQQAVETERTLCFEFNRLRGRDGDQVPETLEGLDANLSGIRFSIPATAPLRLDYQSAALEAEQSKAAWNEVIEKYRPDLSAFASVSGNGFDTDWDEARAQGLDFDNPAYVLGLTFSVPLDFRGMAAIRRGYRESHRSAQLALKDKEIEVNNDWTNLLLEIKDAERRLAMATEIEQLQREKTETEQTRLKEGRTTQFQLLSFENEYQESRLNRLSLVLENLTLLAKARWYMTTGPETAEK